MLVEDGACVQETVKEEFSRDTEGGWGGEEMRGGEMGGGFRLRAGNGRRGGGGGCCSRTFERGGVWH